MKPGKVDLDLLKRLVAELEISLNTAYGIKTDLKSEKEEYVIEMSKATGLASGVMTEAALIVGDIQHLLTQPGSKSMDLLDKIMGGLKGPDKIN
jgi:hypothetical protein